MAEADSQHVYHYTDQNGYNGIRSQQEWSFKAGRQHHFPQNPDGAYFTILPPDAPNLGRRLRVGREKREYVFEFRGTQGLWLLNNDRTLDASYTLYSTVDYQVTKDRQIYCGETEKWNSAA